MLETNTTFTFQRDGDNKTISCTVATSVYDETYVYKTIGLRTTPNQDVDFTTHQVLDFDNMSALETKSFNYTLEEAQQTTANPVDRSGSTPARYGEFEAKYAEVENIIRAAATIHDNVTYLRNKHRT